MLSISRSTESHTFIGQTYDYTVHTVTVSPDHEGLSWMSLEEYLDREVGNTPFCVKASIEQHGLEFLENSEPGNGQRQSFHWGDREHMDATFVLHFNLNQVDGHIVRVKIDGLANAWRNSDAFRHCFTDNISEMEYYEMYDLIETLDDGWTNDDLFNANIERLNAIREEHAMRISQEQAHCNLFAAITGQQCNIRGEYCTDNNLCGDSDCGFCMDWASRDEDSNISRFRPADGCEMCDNDPEFCSPNFCDTARNARNTEREQHFAQQHEQQWDYDLCDGTDVCGCSGCVAEHHVCEEHRVRTAICGCPDPESDQDEDWISDAPDNEELDNDPRVIEAETRRQQREESLEDELNEIRDREERNEWTGPDEWRGIDVGPLRPDTDPDESEECLVCEASCQCEQERQDAIDDHDFEHGVITDSNRHMLGTRIAASIADIYGERTYGNTASWQEAVNNQITPEPSQELDNLIAEMEGLINV